MQDTVLPVTRLKLLVVDDYAPFRRLVKTMFGEGDAQIEECADAGEIVAQFTALRPDWVLMDLEMKPVDGLMATRRLKARFPEAQILILTNHNDKLLREEALKAGASHYVLKENLAGLRALLAGPQDLETEKQNCL